MLRKTGRTRSLICSPNSRRRWVKLKTGQWERELNIILVFQYLFRNFSLFFSGSFFFRKFFAFTRLHRRISKEKNKQKVCKFLLLQFYFAAACVLIYTLSLCFCLARLGSLSNTMYYMFAPGENCRLLYSTLHARQNFSINLNVQWSSIMSFTKAITRYVQIRRSRQ